MIRRHALWLVIGIAQLSSCGSEPNDALTGSYALVGVQASPLPYLETSDADCDQFISEGSLDLTAGGSYNLEFSGPRDCTRSGGQPSTQGRVYNGSFTQTGVNTVSFAAEISGFGTLHFNGTVNPLEAFVTVPPIPPQTGPDLILQFAIVR
jgi:hypothetical protein